MIRSGSSIRNTPPDPALSGSGGVFNVITIYVYIKKLQTTTEAHL